MKLFLTGPIDIGKSRIVDACLAAYTGPLLGFRSGKAPARSYG